MNNEHPVSGQETPSEASVTGIYRTPIGTKILLFVLLCGFSALSSLAPDALLRYLCMAAGSGLFAFVNLLTFSPVFLLSALPGTILAFVLTKSVIAAVPSLVFLTGGAVMTLLLLKRKSKTVTVLGAAVSVGAGILVCLLLSYIAGGGSLSFSVLLKHYNAYFEGFEALLSETLQTYAAAMYPAEDFAGAAVLPANALSNMTDILKVTMPALCCVFAEILGYLAVAVFLLFVRIFRCRLLVPRKFIIELTPAAAIVFMVSYLIMLFSRSQNVTLWTAAAENLVLLLMPGLFVVGLHSLARRARIPERRKSFFLTLLLLIFAFLFSPAVCLFFIVIDGIGEIFFGKLQSFRH